MPEHHAVFFTEPIGAYEDPASLSDGATLNFVLPSSVSTAPQPAGAVISYPHGGSQPLIKAAEARLAVGEGAGAVAICVDTLSMGDLNRILPGVLAATQGIDEGIASFIAALVRPVTEEEFVVLAEAARMISADGIWIHSETAISEFSEMGKKKAENLMILGPASADLPVRFL
ncbi:MAG: hypothetical protein Q3962_09395 [Corynebacterium sp.]|nr:hypothetical protein [Corynebacterium sp.]